MDISGFNLKNANNDDGYFDIFATLDSTPYLNPSRSIFLNTIASNDMPLIVKMRIWGDKQSNDVFSHDLTVALRRAITRGLVSILFERECEDKKMLSTGDLRAKIQLSDDIKKKNW